MTRIASALLVAVSIAATLPARAQTPAEFYRGKTLNLIIPNAPGGSFDLYARLAANHLGRFIPGNPVIVPQNMPGAAGMQAANYLASVAPKDGTVIGNVIGGIVRSQLLGLQGVEFDASKFQYVGAPNNENSLLLMTKTSGISRFEQLLEPSGKVLSIGDSGAATTNHTAALLTRDVLNANIKVVSGYTAAGGVDVAMDQGELGGQYNDWASIKTRTLAKIESGEWLLIGQLTDKPLLNLPQQNVPLILNYAKTQEQRDLLRAGIIVPNQFTRPYFLPPGVHADRVAALRDAFTKTLADSEFLAEAEKAKLDINPSSARELQKLIIDYLAMPGDLKRKLVKVLPKT